MAFIAVARTGDIPAGKGVFVDTGGVVLAVFNAGGGRFHAISPVCQHEDGPLAEGWVENGSAICPWHGYDYDPISGSPPPGFGDAVGSYPVEAARTAARIAEVAETRGARFLPPPPDPGAPRSDAHAVAGAAAPPAWRGPALSLGR